MSIRIVPTRSNGSAHYRQSTPLDGQVFVLHFNFNTRDGNWYLSVHDNDDEPILGAIGRKLVVNYPVLTRCYVDTRPPGELIVQSATTGDPGLFDLGDGTLLVYITEADMATLKAGGEL